MSLPFSQACENNKEPILQVLQRHFVHEGDVLEIAGGTGQHAVYFATHLPWLRWQSSDVAGNVDLLNLRIVEANELGGFASELAPTGGRFGDAKKFNLPLAIPLDVTQPDWGVQQYDYVFSANSLHIMPQTAVVEFFGHLKDIIAPRGILCVYGPFKYCGEFTTHSNANFDLWLKSRDPLSGVRDFETINALAQGAGLTLLEDNAMPANNQLLVWQKA